MKVGTVTVQEIYLKPYFEIEVELEYEVRQRFLRSREKEKWKGRTSLLQNDDGVLHHFV